MTRSVISATAFIDSTEVSQMNSILDVVPDITPEVRELVLRLHKQMMRIRVFEEQLATLIEAREIKCPTHLCIGQEAIAAGVCDVLETRDTVWSAHRCHGHYLAKGGDPISLMSEIFLKSSGCSGGRGGSMHVIARDVGIFGTVPIVAGTVPLAVGNALASKIKHEGTVAVAFFGDGALEEGHVHESMNLAALYKLPVIFVCENNYYATHMHLSERRQLYRLYLAGKVHGVPGTEHDGNDVLAVRNAAEKAVLRARNGDGPSLLEFQTYRWRGHVGAAWDFEIGNRRRELDQWIEKDPLLRTENWLVAAGVDPQDLRAIETVAREAVDRAIQTARNSPYPDPGRILDFVYSTASEAC